MIPIKQIIAKLETHDSTTFQREALEQAILHQEAITPILLEIISHIADDPEFLHENMDYMGFTYALYLLAQFREKRAYPIIVRYFGQLGLEDDELDPTGDVVTEDLKNILASVYDGNLNPIKRIIENREVNEYVRSAALRSLVVLYGNDLISREELISYFKYLIDTNLEQEDDLFFGGSLACCCCDIHPGELYDSLVTCFEQDLIETFTINKQDLDRYMQEDKETVLAILKEHRYFQLVTNVITEMGRWACFHPEPVLKRIQAMNFKDDKPFKVGRNDPCPCGSGKKYKKCCLH
jgi:hypothetical protein